MDTTWAFREASVDSVPQGTYFNSSFSYSQASKIKKEQDAYCDKALANEWADLGEFPEELKWEALVDVLRGHVKVHTHCYEAVDFDSFIRVLLISSGKSMLTHLSFSLRTNSNSLWPLSITLMKPTLCQTC
jgi:hypothetical protein